MRARSVRAALVSFCTAAGGAAIALSPAAWPPSLTWLKPSGETAWTAVLPAPGRESDRALLRAPDWHPSLPDTRVQLFEGEAIDLRALAGKVVVLEFWATWCRPCARQLPALEALARQEGPRGLVALAINSEEPPEIVLPYAKARGLTLPIGRYDSVLDRSLAVRTLPTVIVADRRGRIRARWSSAVAGDEIAGVCRKLLAEVDAPRVDVAEIAHGSGLFDAAWSREAPATIQGMAVVPTGERAKLVVATAQHLFAFDGDGEASAIGPGHAAAGLLRHADLDGDGRSELIGFQRGGERWVELEPTSAEARVRTSPSPLLDVELIPRSGERGGILVLATIGGLMRAPGFGPVEFQKIEGFGEVRDLAITGSTASPEIVGLEPGRRLFWLDSSFTLLHETKPRAELFGLLSHPGVEGVGLAPADVVYSATGRFLPGSGVQAALVTRSGELLLVDLRSGDILFRAAWKGVDRVAAGDLDGDGTDELVVAAGRRLTLLLARAH